MRRAWRFSDGVRLAVLIGLALVATRDIWKAIFELAIRSEESSYILLAPAVAAWLAWLRRVRIRFCRPDPSMVGPIMIALGWGMIHLGHEVAVDLLRDLGALVIVAGAVVTVAGPSILIRFAAVWGALLFLVPVPGRIRHLIAVPLQQSSAAATEWLLVLFGAPVERTGNVLLINGAEVAVAEACNGMRMVAALGLVSYAFVFSVPMRAWARVLLLALTPVVAILANVLRLVPTSLLYGYTGADVAGLFHDVAGWGVLLVALLVLWLTVLLLRYLELPLAPYAIRERV